MSSKRFYRSSERLWKRRWKPVNKARRKFRAAGRQRKTNL